MDHDSFDRFVRLLGGSGSRRTALGTLLVGALGGTAVGVGAKGKHGNGSQRNQAGKGRDRKREQQRGKGKSRQDAPAAVSAEAADCLSPGPSSNMNGCNFSGMDFDEQDLSGSSMRATIFRNASLCGTNLSSSALNNADFRDANLTRADLHSSGCSGIKTNPATTFCQTKMCNGTIRNDDCPGVAAGNVCCDAPDCAERTCRTAACEENRCEYTIEDNGEAGTLCPSPRQCCGGDCCAEGRPCCNGACTNTQTDDDNCGACGNACGDGLTCCGGTCINTQTDDNNCGACGNVCGVGSGCVSGACICIEALQACTTEGAPCCAGRTCQAFSPGCWGPRYCCRKSGEACTNACDCCSKTCVHFGGSPVGVCP